MKKTLLAFSAFSLVAMGTAKAQLFLSQNFNATAAPALPASWASTPTGWQTGAPATVVPDLAGNYGDFAVPEHAAIVGIDGNITTNNNAILSTPAFTPVVGAKLMFDVSYFKYGLTADPTKVEFLSYAFSTNGGATWSTDSIIAPNIVNNATVTWLTKTIDIPATYAGQSIKIGFKYQNSGAALVGAAFDNIKVILGTDVQMLKLATTNGSTGAINTVYAVTGSTMTFTGSAKNAGTTSITTATTAYGPTASAGTVTGLPAATGAAINTSYGTTFTVPAGSTTVKAWIKATGDLDASNDSATITVIGVPSIPIKKLVFEENTCTKCTWCPRGTVGMDEFAEAHPGVAAQIALHDNFQGQDAMAPASLTPYINLLTGPGTGYGGNPSVYIDRRIYDDPGDITGLYNSNMNSFGYANFTMGTPTVSGNAVSVPVTVSPVISINGAKLALVVTESNVSGTTSGYNQTNTAYSGGSRGPMGGFENQPTTVPAASIRYHFVARSISPSPGGEASGLPATMAAGSTNQGTLTATLDPSWNQANLQYIVLLIGSDGQIMNSAFSATPTLLPVLLPATAIANVDAGISNAFIYPNPSFDNAFLQVDLKDATTGTITVVDATGRTISSKDAVKLNNGKNVIEIPTASLSAGLYFVNLNTAKGNVSLKFQVVK